MKDSKIEWTDHTLNPWWGCTKVSQGCLNCYANALAKRTGRDVWGPSAPRRRTTAANWRDPLRWDKAARASGTRARVFCASMADVFEDRPELDPWRIDLWRLILETPNLDWLLLTKRPENVLNWMDDACWPETGCPLFGDEALPPNVWIGTSVENQETADKRIPHLLRIPARVHFLSCEPLLGQIDLTAIRIGNYTLDVLRGEWQGDGSLGYPDPVHSLVDWVICGGESGPHARPMHPAWARSLRDQCLAAGTPYFFKQWGEWALKGAIPDAKAGDFGVLAPDGTWYHQHTGWNGRPIDPDTGEAYMLKVGKQTAGGLLDGYEWHEFPSDRSAAWRKKSMSAIERMSKLFQQYSGGVAVTPQEWARIEAEIADLRTALDAAEQRLANAAKASDHDAGVISDLSAQLEAAQARAERAEAECAAALTRAESAEGELALCRDDLRTAERDVERAEAALRGGEEGE